ncbi:hypothetical protein [Alicyclobacillus dauci]|uniref:Uncharacterized protein n=1 Tax=Alicyclobacillus dauci TaxID=1475485 RepID=A0ABY6Z893_9BACL|nr:hypothetical protein [Alicyclobacillus dauci]WAH38255.1 hypothetical protein NZD86_07170 [Alicyclobacillus dauci]
MSEEEKLQYAVLSAIGEMLVEKYAIGRLMAAHMAIDVYETFMTTLRTEAGRRECHCSSSHL